MTEEHWKRIERYSTYSISDLGRVRSEMRLYFRRNRWGKYGWQLVRPRILRLGSRSGYPLASLHIGDVQITVYVHQEVMRAFGSPPPFEGAFVRHLDDVRSNCHIDNLAWGSQADNMADAKRNGHKLGGLRPKGSKRDANGNFA